MVIEMQPVTSRVTDLVTSSHLWRQVLVSVMAGLMCVCGGFTYGYSAVMVPRVKEDQLFPYSDEYDSWITAIGPLSMAFGCVFAGVLNDKFGRKYTHILLLWPFLIGFLILAFAKSVIYLLLGRLLTGMCAGMYRAATAVYLVEITDPKNRALFQFSLSLSANIGILGIHVIGGYMSLRNSCLIFTIPIFIAFILLIFAKDSPLWLISKGRVEEGKEAFEWYRSKNDVSEKELFSVLEKQSNKTDELSCLDILRIIFSKIFLKAYFTGFVLFVIVQFSGVNNLIFYAQDLLGHTFSGKIDPFVLMIIIDSLRIAGNIILIPVLKYWPRRKSFFGFSFALIFCLVGMIVYLIVEPTGLTWLLLAFLIMFTILGSIIVGTAWTFIAEIYPNSIRGIGSGLGSATSFLLMFISVRLTPEIMDSFGIIVLYSGFAVITLASIVILCFSLPDTDDKSLHEIENNYNK